MWISTKDYGFKHFLALCGDDLEGILAPTLRIALHKNVSHYILGSSFFITAINLVPIFLIYLKYIQNNLPVKQLIVRVYETLFFTRISV